jgi:hypothetical protein
LAVAMRIYGINKYDDDDDDDETVGTTATRKYQSSEMECGSSGDLYLESQRDKSSSSNIFRNSAAQNPDKIFSALQLDTLFLEYCTWSFEFLDGVYP